MKHHKNQKANFNPIINCNKKKVTEERNPRTQNVSVTQEKDTSNLVFGRYLLSKARALLGGNKKVSATQRNKDTSTLIVEICFAKQGNHHVIYICIHTPIS